MIEVWWCITHACSGASATCHAWWAVKNTWPPGWEPDESVAPRCHMVKAELVLSV